MDLLRGNENNHLSHDYRLGPRTDHALEGLAKAGLKDVMLIPIAFTSDHIETLFELDLEYGEVGREVGLTGLTRCDSLNDNPIFIETLAKLVADHLESGPKHSVQYKYRCPGCDKTSCKDARNFFVAK